MKSSYLKTLGADRSPRRRILPLLALLVGLLSLTSLAAPSHAAPSGQAPMPDPQIRAQVKVMLNTAFGLFRSEDYPAALAKLNDTVTLAHQGGDRVGEAEALFGIGLVYASQHDNVQALTNLQQALAIWAEVDNPTVELEALQTIGALYSTPGQFAIAFDFAQQVLTLARAVGDTDTEDAALESLAFLYYHQSRYPEALQYGLQALDLARKTGKRAAEGAALSWVAGSYLALGQRRSALSSFQQALAIARDTGDRVNEALTLASLGEIYLELGQTDQALEFFQQALLIERQVGDRVSEAQTVLAVGSIALQQGRDSIAETNFQQALTIARDLGDRSGEENALSLTGFLALYRGQPARAVELYQEALSIAREIGHRTGEGNLLSAIGYAHEALGDLQTSLDFDRQAIVVLESVRASTRVEEFKIGLAAQAADIYGRTALTLVNLGRPEEAFEVTERARARTFLDQLGNVHLDVTRAADPQLLQQEQGLRAEISALDQQLRSERSLPANQRNIQLIQSLQSELVTRQSAYSDLVTQLKLSDPETASLINVAPLRLAELQGLLGPQSSLLSYFVTNDKTLAFVVTRDRLREVDLRVSRNDLATAVAGFRSFADPSRAAPRPELQQLSNWLIAPVRDLLTTPAVTVIPNDILNYLPFAALTDGQQYFGDLHTVSYLPSASTLPFIQEKRKGHADTLLALAQSQVEGFPALRFADSEARAIAAVYNTQALTGDAATQTAFKEMAGRFDLLHLAAHAELNPANPLFSRILLAPDNQNDGSLTVQQVYGLDLKNADLVVLSACQTQLGGQAGGPQIQGDDFVALNRAFIYAGTPSVIASLWSVNDQATGVLMSSFYRHLRAGLSKAAALQAAQAETRLQFPNPYYWAGFVLTGDPGSTGPS